MATTNKLKMRSLQRCIRSVESFSDGQARIVDWTDDLDEVKVEITPNDGVYKEKKPTFVFLLRLPEGFPNEPPEVFCPTAIYHPNIDPYGQSNNVCLNLFDEWQPKFGIDDVIQGLLFLLYNPNLEDPLSPFFDGSSVEVEEYEENVEKSLNGEIVESFNFGDPASARSTSDNEDEDEEPENANREVGWVKPTEEAMRELGEQYVEGEDEDEEENPEEEGASGGADSTEKDDNKEVTEEDDSDGLTLQRMLSADYGISTEQMLNAETEITSPAILAAEDDTTNLLNMILSGQVTCSDAPQTETPPVEAQPGPQTNTTNYPEQNIQTNSASPVVTSMNELNLRRNVQADDAGVSDDSQMALPRPPLSRQTSKSPAIITPDGENGEEHLLAASDGRTKNHLTTQTSMTESKWKCVIVGLCSVALGVFFRMLRRR